MSGSAIDAVDACEVLDSRGRPTVWCEVTLSGGARGSARVPSGASTSRHERLELRDGGRRYGGRGVLRAVANVATVLGPAIKGLDAADQRAVDETLTAVDGTPDLSRLGANAVLAVSVAVAVAAAESVEAQLYRHLAGQLGVEPALPLPMVNILSGGAHAGGCLDVQDFLVVPVAATSFGEALEWAATVREATRREATVRGHFADLVADEGGLGIGLSRNRDALDLLCAGIEAAGLTPGTEVAIAIDVAASQLTTPTGYVLRTERREFDAAGLISEISEWCRDYPIVSVEDPLAEDDWSGWQLAASRLATTTQLLGDDLFATDLQRLQRGINAGVANAVLVKPNQVGTLTGAVDVLQLARSAGFATVVSARSGETEDSWLADLAVGWAAGQIKVGSTTRSERTAKWNRLLEIEHVSGSRVPYAGPVALAHRATGPSKP
jgi:enolase